MEATGSMAATILFSSAAYCTTTLQGNIKPIILSA